MKIITRYIFKEMIGPTVLGFAFYTSIILMQKLFDMAGMIIRRSLSAAAVGKLLLLSLPHIIVLTVPMSLLFGVLIAIGRLSSDSEIIAMRALGEPDAFPLGDLGLRQALGLAPAALEKRAEAWRPWRAYATMYLWKSLVLKQKEETR